MSDESIFRLTDKESALSLRWLMQSASKDESRPILTGFKVDGAHMVTADGHTLAIMPTIEGFEGMAGERVIVPHGTVPTTLLKAVDYHEYPGQYPTYNQVIPQGPPIFRIGINREYLGRLGTMPSDSHCLVLDFYGDTQPVKVSSLTGGKPYTSVIMPMFINHPDAEGLVEKLDLPAVKPVEVDHDKCIDREIRMKDQISAQTLIIKQLHDELEGLREEQRRWHNETYQEMVDVGAALEAVQPEPEGEPDFDAVGAALKALGLLAGDEPEQETVSVEATTAYERHTFGHKSNGGGSNGGMKSLDIDALLG